MSKNIFLTLFLLVSPKLIQLKLPPCCSLQLPLTLATKHFRFSEKKNSRYFPNELVPTQHSRGGRKEEERGARGGGTIHLIVRGRDESHSCKARRLRITRKNNRCTSVGGRLRGENNIRAAPKRVRARKK